MIIVFGSIAIDMVTPVPSLPSPGQHIHTDFYKRVPGGRGATQAIAAARIGSKVAMVGRIGEDGFGTQMFNRLKHESILCSGVPRSQNNPTGVNIVLQTPEHDKTIISVSGANKEVYEDQVPDEILTSTNAMLFQMEVPHEEVWTLIRRCKERGTKTMLNLAPAGPIPEDILHALDYICLNQAELKYLCQYLKGKEIEEIAAQYELHVVVTLSERGAVLIRPNGKTFKASAIKIDNIADTLGCGDVFCGAFFAALYNGKSHQKALEIGCIAASLNCRTAGTQEGIPFYDEVRKYLKEGEE